MPHRIRASDGVNLDMLEKADDIYAQYLFNNRAPLAVRKRRKLERQNRRKGRKS